MPRFQASLRPNLELFLQEIQRDLGLQTHQKAELLEEIVLLARWMIQQAKEGRKIEANDEEHSYPCELPRLQRLQQEHSDSFSALPRLVLSEEEVRRLSELLQKDFQPTPHLDQILENLQNRRRSAPSLQWKE